MLKVALSDGTQLASFALDALRAKTRPVAPAPSPSTAPTLRVRMVAPLSTVQPPSALPQPGLSAADRQELEAALHRARRLHAKYQALLG